jgi:hypothetical protein
VVKPGKQLEKEINMLGYFRKDEDSHLYFVPEAVVESFDNAMTDLCLTEFYGDEWEEKNEKFNDNFGEYRLNHSFNWYLVDCDVEGQE